MTLLMPTCAQVTDLLTDYEDGALGPLDWLGLKVHLSLCPPCRTLLNSLHDSLALLRDAWPDTVSPIAEQALTGALTAIRSGKLPAGPQHHPKPDDWVGLPPEIQPFLALMFKTHLGHCEMCRESHRDHQAIPPSINPLESLKPHLPPETQWRWIRRGLGGGSIAILHRDATSGASFSLACLPGGRSTPVHDHEGFEGILILSGGLQDGPAHLRAGDWISHGIGYQHGPTADPGQTCWALVTQERPVRFTGWRGLVAGLLG
jgi:anti-sigma factor ChrR (cupin superfamily)